MSAETDARVWLEYAEADRHSAYSALAVADYRDVAFHCQQAVEKALKALVVHSTGQRPPYVHNLRQLLDQAVGRSAPASIVDAVLSLNPHYRATRYPGVADSPDVYTASRAQRLLRQMDLVLEWVRDRIS
ncbi:MAG TPA: HEPN domain-containing protein [Chloroflexi bacterium]|nr:HEPN domain-containing protein [Chloroflexota bacterium]